jgi:hypothetical protein
MRLLAISKRRFGYVIALPLPNPAPIPKENPEAITVMAVEPQTEHGEEPSALLELQLVHLISFAILQRLLE